MRRFARAWLSGWLRLPATTQATVTVVVPVYRSEQYLADCLASILDQSLKDFHVVVVDDGSPGAVGQIVRRAAGNDRRVTLLRHQENRGTLAARMTGAGAATSRYLAFVDSDDILEPTFLEVMFRTAERYDADVTECAIAVVEPDGTRWLVNRGGRPHQSNAVLEAFLDGKMSNSLSNKLIRTDRWREAATRLGDSIGHLSFGDDLLMMFFISLSAERYAHLDDPFYIYMRRSDSSTTTEGEQADALRAQSLRMICAAMMPILEQSPCSAEVTRRFLQREFLDLVPDCIPAPTVNSTNDGKTSPA